MEHQEYIQNEISYIIDEYVKNTQGKRNKIHNIHLHLDKQNECPNDKDLVWLALEKLNRRGEIHCKVFCPSASIAEQTISMKDWKRLQQKNGIYSFSNESNIMNL